MSSKVELVLNKYIKFINMYNDKLPKNTSNRVLYSKNTELLSNLDSAFKLILPNSNIDRNVDIGYFENKPLNYLDFCQNKIKNSILHLSLNLRPSDFNLNADNEIFSLLALVEFSKLTKDNLKIADILDTLDNINNSNSKERLFTEINQQVYDELDDI